MKSRDRCLGRPITHGGYPKAQWKLECFLSLKHVHMGREVFVNIACSGGQFGVLLNLNESIEVHIRTNCVLLPLSIYQGSYIRSQMLISKFKLIFSLDLLLMGTDVIMDCIVTKVYFFCTLLCGLHAIM